MQKAGMMYEGLLRQRMFAKGRFWDLKQYAIIKMMSSYRDCNRKYLNNNLNGIILDMENLI